jgi:transposase
MKKGGQKTLPAHAGQRQNLHCVGAYDYQTDTVHCQVMAAKTGTQFIYFLEKLIWQVYPHSFLVLVLDNASYHHTAAVHAFLSLVQTHVEVIFLPPYCPELNLIERFWRHLKDHATANTLFPSLNDLCARVDGLCALQNDPTHPLRFSLSKHFR